MTTGRINQVATDNGMTTSGNPTTFELDVVPASPAAHPVRASESCELSCSARPCVPINNRPTNQQADTTSTTPHPSRTSRGGPCDEDEPSTLVYDTQSEHPFRGRNRQDRQSSTELSYATEMLRTIETRFDTRCKGTNTLESALSGRAPTISPEKTRGHDDPIK